MHTTTTVTLAALWPRVNNTGVCMGCGMRGVPPWRQIASSTFKAERSGSCALSSVQRRLPGLSRVKFVVRARVNGARTTFQAVNGSSIHSVWDILLC